MLGGLPVHGPLVLFRRLAGAGTQEEAGHDVAHPLLLRRAVVLLVEAKVLHLPLVVEILLRVHLHDGVVIMICDLALSSDLPRFERIPERNNLQSHAQGIHNPE